MRVVEEPVQVQTEKNTPTLIRRGPTLYHVVHLIEYWVVQSKWWLHEERRLYMRLLTDQGMIEVFCREDEWILSKIWD